MRGVIAAALVLALHAPVAAQSPAGRVAVEAVASASTSTEDFGDPFLIFDATGTVRVGKGWDVVVRPWARRLTGGNWSFEMYQLQLRYVSSTRVPFRLDAGIISSPLGLATLELRPDRNPLVSIPFYYFTPLPAIDGRFERLTLLSGGYPLGAMFSVSGERWDARAGVTDGTPARPRSVISDSRAAAEPQVVLGGGVSPLFGLRLGAGYATGTYRSASTTAAGQPLASQNATIFNLEGEYAVGYTRVSGEWVRNTFGTPLGDAVARGFNIQATQTLSPRWFAAARATRASSPILTAAAPTRLSSSAVEATLGYRLTTEVTLRGGYEGSRRFRDAGWNHSALVSFVWAERWW